MLDYASLELVFLILVFFLYFFYFSIEIGINFDIITLFLVFYVYTDDKIYCKQRGLTRKPIWHCNWQCMLFLFLSIIDCWIGQGQKNIEDPFKLGLFENNNETFL